MSEVSDHHLNSGREIRLSDLMAILLLRWRVVAGVFGATVLVAAMIALLLPETYTSRTVIVPAPGTSGGRGQLMLGQLPAGVADLVGGSGQGNESLIRIILKSRSLGDSIVGRVTGAGVTEEEVREILRKQADVEVGPEGAIAITVTTGDSVLSQQIASEFPRLVNVMAAEITREAALRRQTFLEAQLAAAREMLIESEQDALEFQLQSEAPEVQEQARRTVEAAAELQQQIIQHEVRVSQLSRTATPENPELSAARAELSALRTQLRRLTSGASGEGFFLSLEKSPELKLGAARLLRDLAKNEKVYTALLASLTETQLEVRNDLPVVSVVDAAKIPKGPSGPRVAVILALAGVLGLVGGIVAALVTDWLERLGEDPANSRLVAAWHRMREDLPHLPHRTPRAAEPTYNVALTDDTR